MIDKSHPIIRQTRMITYIGPRDIVNKTLEQSITGVKRIGELSITVTDYGPPVTISVQPRGVDIGLTQAWNPKK